MEQKSSKPTALPASPAHGDDSMGFLVRQTYNAFMDALHDRLGDHGISVNTCLFVRALPEKGSRSLKELSEELGLTSPTTVSAMDNLEQRGIVRRERGQDDRRIVNIMLTEQGLALKKELSNNAADVNQMALAALSDAEVHRLRKALIDMSEALDEDSDRLEASRTPPERPAKVVTKRKRARGSHERALPITREEVFKMRDLLDRISRSLEE